MTMPVCCPPFFPSALRFWGAFSREKRPSAHLPLLYSGAVGSLHISSQGLRLQWLWVQIVRACTPWLGVGSLLKGSLGHPESLSKPLVLWSSPAVQESWGVSLH